MGERELFCRTIEAEFAQRHAKRRVGAIERVARGGIGLDEVLAHAGLLGALSREKKYDVHALI
jgi:hypothetical protein